MTELSVVQQPLRPSSLAEVMTLANCAAKSAFAGPYRNKPDDAALAILHGLELGMSPIQSLTSIAVINGKPAVFGDAVAALCRAAPCCEDIIETADGDGDRMVAKCIAKRRGCEPVVKTFSVGDAKRAGLWGKAGPWTQYPAQMLAARARGFALRAAFPDVLRGIWTVEESRDIADPPVATVTATVVQEPATPQPSEDIAAAAATAIEQATRRETLDRIRARIEARVLSGDLEAAAAEQLVATIESKCHTFTDRSN